MITFNRGTLSNLKIIQGKDTDDSDGGGHIGGVESSGFSDFYKYLNIQTSISAGVFGSSCKRICGHSYWSFSKASSHTMKNTEEGSQDETKQCFQNTREDLH